MGDLETANVNNAKDWTVIVIYNRDFVSLLTLHQLYGRQANQITIKCLRMWYSSLSLPPMAVGLFRFDLLWFVR